MNGAPPIRTVAAVIADAQGRVLLVRKRGSRIFIQPGGKPEAGEDALATLRRELAEELGVELDTASLRHLGEFEADAVHEAGRRVRGDAWSVGIVGTPHVQAEIEQLCWIDPQPPYPVEVAPLSARHILPAYLRSRPNQPATGLR